MPPENVRKPLVFRGYRNGTLGWNGLKLEKVNRFIFHNVVILHYKTIFNLQKILSMKYKFHDFIRQNMNIHSIFYLHFTFVYNLHFSFYLNISMVCGFIYIFFFFFCSIIFMTLTQLYRINKICSMFWFRFVISAAEAVNFGK